MKKIDEYLSGKVLYGDDFKLSKIKTWYDEESEGYANLGSKKKNYHYGYHALNIMHGLSKLPQWVKFDNVLGFGAAYGHELTPIIDRINQITIIEPSENLQSKFLGNIIPNYCKPNIDGSLLFPDNSFDLITCFGALHHIPNVSFVLSELTRVLKPQGYLLIREPIVSMGNWRNIRIGLTKNERGIPLHLFLKIFKANNIHLIWKSIILPKNWTEG
jgi:SAM-dependent methyltransferase